MSENDLFNVLVFPHLIDLLVTLVLSIRLCLYETLNGFLLQVTSAPIVRSRGGYRIPRRRGANPWGVGRGAPTYKFAGFSQKLHEIKKILIRRGGAAPGAPPLDPPLRSKTLSVEQLALYLLIVLSISSLIGDSLELPMRFTNSFFYMPFFKRRGWAV